MRSIRVLVAEDDELTRKAITKIINVAAAMLKDEGRIFPVEITYAEDGEQAVAAYLKAKAQGKPFDIVSMDYKMSKIDNNLHGDKAIAQIVRIDGDATIVVNSSEEVTADRLKALMIEGVRAWGSDISIAKNIFYSVKPLTLDGVLGQVVIQVLSKVFAEESKDVLGLDWASASHKYHEKMLVRQARQRTARPMIGQGSPSLVAISPLSNTVVATTPESAFSAGSVQSVAADAESPLSLLALPVTNGSEIKQRQQTFREVVSGAPRSLSGSVAVAGAGVAMHGIFSPAEKKESDLPPAAVSRQDSKDKAAPALAAAGHGNSFHNKRKSSSEETDKRSKVKVFAPAPKPKRGCCTSSAD